MTVTEVAPDNVDRMIAKVIKLIDRAGHPDTPEAEAKSCEAAAAKIMDRYDIYESMLIEARPSERITPILKKIPVYPVKDVGDAAYYMRDLLDVLARHVGVRINFDTKHEDLELEDGSAAVQYRTAAIVGFESDIRYLEILYAQLRMHILTNLTNRWNPRQSLEENVVRLHEVGVGYDLIADMAESHGFPEYTRGALAWDDDKGRHGAYAYPLAKASKAKLMRVYDNYCRKHGRQKVLARNPQNYRMWFLSGYTNMIRVRVNTMAELRHETMAEVDQETGREGGSALALRNRTERVDDAFYNFFPQLRPSPEPATAAATRRRPRRGRVHYVSYNKGAESAGSSLAKTADLSGGRGHVTGSKRELGS